MLQQILKDMYIDPDVLEALNEEQKKILFLKMRQEQVRRWKEREEKLEREGSTALKPKPKKAHSKSVSWLLGRDGDVQVCIIGEADEFKTSKFIYSNLGQTKGSNLQSNTRHQSNTVRSSLVKRGCTEPENLPSQTPPGIQLHFKGVPTESGSDQQPPPPQVSQPEQQPSSSVDPAPLSALTPRPGSSFTQLFLAPFQTCLVGHAMALCFSSEQLVNNRLTMAERLEQGIAGSGTAGAPVTDGRDCGGPSWGGARDLSSLPACSCAPLLPLTPSEAEEDCNTSAEMDNLRDSGLYYRSHLRCSRMTSISDRLHLHDKPRSDLPPGADRLHPLEPQTQGKGKEPQPAPPSLRMVPEEAGPRGAGCTEEGDLSTGRGRVAQLMKTFSTPSLKQSTPSRPKPPIPTKPSHLQLLASPSLR
ncbi:hypothetical protein JZ751_006996 [Albula glossodonta]|uniref:SH2 domain containing 4A n=1 Tax=Albula glossodonta TaxID=121402 RepID=A0A8T2P2J4_9TELE|nr:hypothetical protein JZ751_006996 [Albula glossodonta]